MKEISRYFFSKSDIRQDNTFRFNLFQPPKPNYDLSVYLTSGLTDAEIWAIGDAHVSPLRGKEILGAAQINTSDVLEEGLSIDHNGIPHHLHANLIGWKRDTEDRVIALKLAAKASALFK